MLYNTLIHCMNMHPYCTKIQYSNLTIFGHGPNTDDIPVNNDFKSTDINKFQSKCCLLLKNLLILMLR